MIDPSAVDDDANHHVSGTEEDILVSMRRLASTKARVLTRLAPQVGSDEDANDNPRRRRCPYPCGCVRRGEYGGTARSWALSAIWTGPLCAPPSSTAVTFALT